jgi:hypothetical protein
MPWDDQVTHSKVAELRTVSGSRHEFVDRENRIILEYRAKNAYRIEYLGLFNGVHQFRLLNGFNETVSGQSVRVTSHDGAWLLGPVRTLTTDTDGNGVFGIRLEPNPNPPAPDPTRVTVQAGNTEQDFDLSNPRAVPELTLAVVEPSSPFVTGPNFWSRVSIRADAALNGSPVNIDGKVIWTVVNSSINNADPKHWWANRSAGAMNGLAWGSTAISVTSGASSERTNMGDGSNNDNGGGMGADYHASTSATIVSLTDIVGSRKVRVKASVDIDGDGTPETAEILVEFKEGPLSVFYAPIAGKTWTEAYTECNPGYTYPANSKGPDYPLPAVWPSNSNPNDPAYYYGGGDANIGGSGGMPFPADLQRVSANPTGQGAAFAAGWSGDRYRSGEADTANYAYLVRLSDGSVPSGPYGDVNTERPVVCRR